MDEEDPEEPVGERTMAKQQVVVPCETALQINCPHFSVFHRETIIVDKLLYSSLINKLLYSSLIDALLYSCLINTLFHSSLIVNCNYIN